MIYPQKISSRTSEIIIKSLLLFFVVLSITLFIINKMVNPEIPWSPIVNAGIVYTWITVIYSIKRNTNLAAHVLLQLFAISCLVIYIDNKLNFTGWSIYIGIPIILIIANIIMLILSIVTYKKYFKYVIYQLIIVILSCVPTILGFNKIINIKVLQIIATSISCLNLFVSLGLNYKAFYKSLESNFHM